MNLFRRSIELVVIRDIFNPQNNIESYTGYNVEQLLKQAFGGNGLSDSVRLYHGNLLDEVTPKTPQDVDRVMRLHGRIYAVVKPMGIETLIAVGISILVSVAVAFLMPTPAIANQSANQPPSPNNALAARTNKQRLGGRVPEIFGTVWSVPDLIAPSYTAYINNEETEFSLMCVGRGYFDVKRALDDTSDVELLSGATVEVFDPDTSIRGTPSKRFGEPLTVRETSLSRLAVKRYTAVNGQVLLPPDSDISSSTEVVVDALVTVRSGGVIEIYDTSRFGDFTVGQRVSVYFKSNVEFSGEYFNLSIASTNISSVTERSMTVSAPNWGDIPVGVKSSPVAVTIRYLDGQAGGVSDNEFADWSDWFYTSDPTANGLMVNLIAPNGLYDNHPDKPLYVPFNVVIDVKVENVDSSGQPIFGTVQNSRITLEGRNSLVVGGQYQLTSKESSRQTAANTRFISTNGNVRVAFRRASKTVRFHNDRPAVAQEVRIKDLYSYRNISLEEMPSGVTLVMSKTLATEGALSLKERKLRLLVQRYVTDATSGLPKLSNRADDILRHIATDPKVGNLQLSQVDIAQIKAEIDAQIAYFGTDKCSEFCGTFDDNNLSAEETMQIVAKAVFSQAKRQGNKIMLDFERKVPASVAVFNSHNILPDTFTAPQSLGIANDYDGVKVEYTDPVDDAVITMSYPNDAIVNPHEDKLIGVRNKVQAHMHMMRMYNKDRHAYKSCEFVAGDESNIVVRTNRITVADQLRADVQQGSVEGIETIGSDIVLHTTDPVTIEPTGAYTMFIQTINNGVEAIAVTARDDYSVKLARLPSGEISGTDKAVQAVYQIVAEQDDSRNAYLVAQKDPSDGMTNKLLCTNYDDRYYQNDSDFTNGLIT